MIQIYKLNLKIIKVEDKMREGRKQEMRWNERELKYRLTLLMLIAFLLTLLTACRGLDGLPLVTVTTFAGSAGSPGSADGTEIEAQFRRIYGITIADDGTLFVTDTFNRTIRKITPAGVVTTFAGSAGSPGSADGTGTGARFNKPFGITIADDGTLFMTDAGNHTIRKITPAGVVTAFAGSVRAIPGSADDVG